METIKVVRGQKPLFEEKAASFITVQGSTSFTVTAGREDGCTDKMSQRMRGETGKAAPCARFSARHHSSPKTPKLCFSTSWLKLSRCSVLADSL